MGLPTRGVIENCVSQFLSSILQLNLCAIHFYDWFAKYGKSTKNIGSSKKVVEGLQSTAVAASLRFSIDFVVAS